MQPLKDAIDHKLLPSLVKHELSDVELELMKFPARFGGMSFDDPVADSRRKHDDSIKCTANLTQQILENGADLMQSIELDRRTKVDVRHHEALLIMKADDVQKRLPEDQQRAMAQAHSPPSLLLSMVSFFDVKADFHDHVHLRYGWPLDNLPSICPCGERFTVDHAQICKLSGFIHMRHDDPTDFLASCLKEVHNDVEIEPKLQSLSGESFRHRTANRQFCPLSKRVFGSLAHPVRSLNYV